MEEYKKYVDHQHAPESLIADTIKKVKAEEVQKKKKKPFGKIMTAGMTAVAAAAAIAVLVQVYPAGDEIHYQQIEEQNFRGFGMPDQETETSLENADRR